MRFLLAILLIILFHASFLQAKEPSFKFTFGAILGNIPIEINKMSEGTKNIGGVKINSWILSPKLSSFNDYKKKLNFTENKLEENLYIKINYKF